MKIKRLIVLIILGLLAIIGLALWQNHTNSLGYEFRNCTEVSDNNDYIGFKCPNKNPNYPATTIYVPSSEREDVINDLSPADTGNGSM